MPDSFSFGQTRFVGSADLTGPLEIYDRHTGELLCAIPAEDIVAFVADYVVRERFRQLRGQAAPSNLFVMPAKDAVARSFLRNWMLNSEPNGVKVK